MQGIKYHSPKRHKKSLKHARLLVLQRFYFLRTVKDGIIAPKIRKCKCVSIYVFLYFSGRLRYNAFYQKQKRQNAREFDS